MFLGLFYVVLGLFYFVCFSRIFNIFFVSFLFNFIHKNNKHENTLDKHLTADKYTRKHVCGHFCGMKGNNA